MSEFTPKEKRKAIERELKFRRRVYPRWIEAGRYTQAHADREIAVLEAIRLDYVAEEEKGRLL